MTKRSVKETQEWADYEQWIKDAIGAIAITNEGKQCEVTSTGSVTLDKAFGIGGFPKETIVEIFGADGSGKTTLAMSAIAEMQRTTGQKAIYIDSEARYYHTTAQNLGIDDDLIKVFQPDDKVTLVAENVVKIVEKALQAVDVQIIVIDSIATLQPRAMFDGDDLDLDSGGHIALLPRLMSKCLPRWAGITRHNKKLLLIINQVRAKFGGMINLYRENLDRPCGKTLRHCTGMTLELRQSEQIKKNGEKIGHFVAATTEKTNFAQYTKCKFPLIYGEGIDNVYEAIELGKILGIFYNNEEGKVMFDGHQLGKTTESARKFFFNNPTVLEDLIKRIMIT